MAIYIHNDTIKIPGKDSYLKITDFDNFFEIFYDKNDNLLFNLNTTLYLNVGDIEQLDKYVLDTYAHWPLISYKIYGTTRLAWVLLKINNIEPKDIFKIKEPGDTIYYLNREILAGIIDTLNNEL